MANPWCRLYSEFEDDPKVQMLPEVMQRRLVMLFCQWCKGERRTEAQIAFKWHVSMSDLAETKALFMENGFIDDAWRLINWTKRQFISDSSTERVRRHRERSETLQKRDETNCNVIDTDTEAETDTETETEQKQINTLAPSELAAKAPPIGTLPCVGKKKSWPLYQAKVDEWQETYPGIDAMAELRAARQWLIDNPTDRKTFGGMPRFLNRWLSKAQNERGRKSNGHLKHSGLQGPASERQQQNIGALKQVMDASGDYAPGHVDRQDPRLLPESGAEQGNANGIPPGPQRDRH